MIKQPPREITNCVCCGTKGPRAARGLIRSCYMRHYRAGSLDRFPRERGIDPRRGRIDECVCCGTEGPIKGRGLTYNCYQRHRWAGTLDQFPLDPEPSIVRAQDGWKLAHANRVEDYAELRSWGESPEQAMRRIGLKGSKSTIERYERLAQVMTS